MYSSCIAVPLPDVGQIDIFRSSLAYRQFGTQ